LIYERPIESYPSREQYINSGQGFLLVFSITSLSSLNELYKLREQIIRIKDDEKVPLVIVGNKSDLEEDRAVSKAQALAVSEGWSHIPYYETSARRRANVDEAFMDLCGQIIRKDMASAQVRDHDIIRREKPFRNPARRRRRREIHCTIL
jgi:Ras-related protein Rap-1B